MTNRHSFSSTDHLNRDLNESPKTVDRVLNAAIVRADIAENFEKYLEIFEAFYADDIEVSSDTQKEPIRGRAKVRSLLFDFLVPLHVVGNRKPVGIYPTDGNSRGWCTRNAFRVDARGFGREQPFSHQRQGVLMQFTKFGQTGLTVSRMILGMGTFGKQTDEKEAHRMLDKAAEAGINFIDTA
jgi:hypothetical protein